ncbi:MAG: P44/Msp2 family outer membrane protein [Anaplasma sp.]
MKEIRGLTFLALTALLVPSQLSASPRPVDFSRSAGSAGFFASAQYKLAVPRFSGFVVESDTGRELGVFSPITEGSPAATAGEDTSTGSGPGSFLGRYSPSYLKSTRSGSVAVGYSSGSLRLEAEGSYQSFLSNAGKGQGKESDKAYELAASESQDGALVASTKPNASYYVTLRNKEVQVVSLLANLCYDLLPEDSHFSPSACAGIGGGVVKFMGVTAPRWSYQAKVGLQYFISRKTALFSYAYVSKVHSKKFTDVPARHHHGQATATATASGSTGGTQVSSATAVQWLYPQAGLDLSYFGFECGIRLIL